MRGLKTRRIVITGGASGAQLAASRMASGVIIDMASARGLMACRATRRAST